MISPAVVVHADTRCNDERIRNLGHPAGGVIVADVLPLDLMGLSHVAEAILDGLGKDPWLWTAYRASEALASAWLRTGEVTDVVLPDSQLLGPALAAKAASWIAAQGVRPWFLCATRTAQAPSQQVDGVVEELVVGCGAERVGWEHFAEQFTPPSPQAYAPSGPRELPRLPRVDGVVFRSACTRLLGDDAGRVDALFVDAVQALRAGMRGLDQANRKRQLLRLLRHRIEEAPTAEHLILVARAAQAAGIVEGWYVKVNTNVLLGAAAVLPRRGQAELGRWWERLRAYRDPDPGAIAALYLAGVDVRAIPAITLQTVSEDDAGGVLVKTAAGSVPVAAPASSYLRCLVAYRKLCGAAGRDRLFVTHRRPDVSDRYVGARLRDPDTDLGITLTTSRTPSTHPGPELRVAQFGITVEKLVKAPNKKP